MPCSINRGVICILCKPRVLRDTMQQSIMRRSGFLANQELKFHYFTFPPFLNQSFIVQLKHE